MSALYWLSFGVFWSIALWTDMKYRKIPNWLTGAFAVSGLLMHVVLFSWEGIPAAASGMLIGLAITLPFYLCRAVGAGDVKLFMAAGAWTGAWYALLLWCYTILLAGCIGIIWLLWEERRSRRLRECGMRLLLLAGTRDRTWLYGWSRRPPVKMPLMLAAAPGAVLLFWLHPIS
ncbi:prepilin peptidase [Xylanibacillus composti]|uniref:Prepilin peptidase n=1 Tax=Xylanibacillus composti TaxID=1572762 RepID=A0A8J4H3Z9_9BACL|nr:prepilin peptidase [Xylanibacillus composti]